MGCCERHSLAPGPKPAVREGRWGFHRVLSSWAQSATSCFHHQSHVQCKDTLTLSSPEWYRGFLIRSIIYDPNPMTRGQTQVGEA